MGYALWNRLGQKDPRIEKPPNRGIVTTGMSGTDPRKHFAEFSLDFRAGQSWVAKKVAESRRRTLPQSSMRV
jgi:hypothetical protein